MDKIWTMVEVGDCWEWQGYLTNGYGRVKRGGKTQAVHRYIYEQLVGPVDALLDLDHRCRNRKCCNPDHLEPVTRAVNLNRGVKHQTTKTHCKYNHPYSVENTLQYAGRRHCLTCKHWRDTHRGIPASEQPRAVLD